MWKHAGDGPGRTAWLAEINALIPSLTNQMIKNLWLCRCVAMGRDSSEGTIMPLVRKQTLIVSSLGGLIDKTELAEKKAKNK